MAPTAQDIQEMREWIADCEGIWKEDAEELEDLTDAQVLRGVARHYAGGIAQFIADAS